ncbi:PfkB family carbohydrate kinase [Anaeromyxobacter diazotrophicus]|uniref:Ribokinase n=1 Tax=Anaeromyxobacter diazotrophicus TaxID=2590199 RepID=A0A7I9VNY0_9BACT|nr:PfkB family carbohydrate kinase [Anaeromyxobacter diazotrophicus]GEJ58124.1 ribokinase [Anaeromyxobacter diazotrophicus]
MTRGVLRLAVVGHVEHVTLGRVPALPPPGGIAHLAAPRTFAGGGGGVALLQLAKAPAEVHLFTALGSDEAAGEVAAALRGAAATVHAARRAGPHTRDVVLVTPDGERTIVVVGEPLHPRAEDPLPWELLAACDAVYFTAQDPAALRRCRAARRLVVSARRREALAASGVRADVVVGSAVDPREASRLADYPVPPGALVLTEGPAGGRVERADGTVERFPAPPPARVTGAAYGAGDSFAGALTFFLACGLPVVEACARAGPYGAAVLAGLDPGAAQLPLVLTPA